MSQTTPPAQSTTSPNFEPLIDSEGTEFVAAFINNGLDSNIGNKALIFLNRYGSSSANVTLVYKNLTSTNPADQSEITQIVSVPTPPFGYLRVSVIFK